MLYDVAIIGAGPAGCSAAITLARAGARVILLERSSFPRHKVCGEFVSAESLGLLRSLISPSVALDVNHTLRISRTRLFIDGRMITATIDPSAASITRHELDLALWETARRHCGVRDNCEVSALALSEAGDFVLRVTAGETLTARAVIDATGRWSRLRDDRAPAGPKWIGLKCHLRELADTAAPISPESAQHFQSRNLELGTASVDLYFFDLGYCGVQPIAPGVVNACAMVRSDRATTLPEVFALHPALDARARQWTPLFDPISTAPLVFRPPRPIRILQDPDAEDSKFKIRNSKLIFSVGDAAAFIDPFVGDGISLALRSGVAAGEALSTCIRGEVSLDMAAETYAAAYRREFTPILKSAAHVRRLLNTPRALRTIGISAMRLPFIANYVIRKTRTIA